MCREFTNKVMIKDERKIKFTTKQGINTFGPSPKGLVRTWQKPIVMSKSVFTNMLIYILFTEKEQNKIT